MRVTVAGAGPTGALLALGLARLGCRVTLHDPLSADQLLARSRAYALTHSSRRLLQRLDLWTPLGRHLIAFHSLLLEDDVTSVRVPFGADDLRGGNRSIASIGWILDHRPLMELLLQRLRGESSITLDLGTAQSLVGVQPDMAIACDGPSSPHRQAWGLPVWSLPYEQGCLTLKVRLRGAQPTTAYELFRAEGPFAVLPLGDQLFQIVWSAPLSRCRTRAALPSHVLLDQLAAVLPDGLEPDALLDRPSAIPLQLSVAPRLHRGRRLLVGEAGHRCHPVGGQGLNLCWRDVSDLLDLVAWAGAAKAGPGSVANRYSRRRLPDLVLVGVATDLLVRLFSNSNPFLLPIRQLGLQLLRRSRWLRRICLSLMTDGPLTGRHPSPELSHGDQLSSSTETSASSARFPPAEARIE